MIRSMIRRLALALTAGVVAWPVAGAELMRCSGNGIDPPLTDGPVFCLFDREKDPRQTTLRQLYGDGWRIVAVTRAPADARNPTDRWWFYLERPGS